MKFLLVLSAALAAAYGEASEPRAQLRPITTYYKPELFGNYVPTFLLPTRIVQQPLYPLGVPSDPTLRPPVKGVVRGPQPWGTNYGPNLNPSITVPEQGTETIIGQLSPTEQGTLSPETKSKLPQVAPADCPWCGPWWKGVVRGYYVDPFGVYPPQVIDPTLRPPVKGVVRGPRPSGQPSITVPEYGTENIIGQLAPEEQGTLRPENIIAQVAPADCPWCRKGVVRGVVSPLLPALTDDFQDWESRPPAQDSFERLTEQSNKKGVVRGTRPLSPLPVQGVQIVTKVPATSTVCLNYMGAAVSCANGMPMPVDQPSKLGVVRRPQGTWDTQARPRPPPPQNHDLTFGSEGPAIGSGAVITGDIFGGGAKREE